MGLNEAKAKNQVKDLRLAEADAAAAKASRRAADAAEKESEMAMAKKEAEAEKEQAYRNKADKEGLARQAEADKELAEKKYQDLKGKANSAAVDAASKAAQAKAKFQIERKLEGEAEAAIEALKLAAAQAAQKAKEAQMAAAQAVQDAVDMKEKLRKAKCGNNPGCMALHMVADSYCCPTLNGIHLTGVRLDCCSPPSSELAMDSVTTDTSRTAMWVASMALAAIASSALTLKLRGRSDQDNSYRSMAA